MLEIARGDMGKRMKVESLRERIGLGKDEIDSHYLSINFPKKVESYLVPPALAADNFVPIISRGGESQFVLTVLDKTKKFSERRTPANFHFGFSSMDSTLSSADKRKGEPVFYCHLGRLNDDRRAVVLETIDIHDAYRGKGLGGDFVSRLATLLGELGFDKIVALAENTAAGEFYRKMGFVRARGEVLNNMLKQGVCSKEEIGSAMVFNVGKN